jgi:hypothetical protein
VSGRGERLIDVTLALHRDAPGDRAILVSQDGDEKAAFWLPRERIEFVVLPGKWVSGARGAKLAMIEARLPEWLAQDRGLT